MAEAKFGAVFVNAKTGTVTGTPLTERGHPQKATDLKTDKSTTDGINNKIVKQKRPKAPYMHFYWIQDRAEQRQFDVDWTVGDTRMGDYFTKHHSPIHHKRMHQYYLHIVTNPMIRHSSTLPVLRGCATICTCTISRPGRGHTITHARCGHTYTSTATRTTIVKVYHQVTQTHDTGHTN
jgi:hypothetical protein